MRAKYLLVLFVLVISIGAVSAQSCEDYVVVGDCISDNSCYPNKINTYTLSVPENLPCEQRRDYLSCPEGHELLQSSNILSCEDVHLNNYDYVSQITCQVLEFDDVVTFRAPDDYSSEPLDPPRSFLCSEIINATCPTGLSQTNQEIQSVNCFDEFYDLLSISHVLSVDCKYDGVCLLSNNPGSDDPDGGSSSRGSNNSISTFVSDQGVYLENVGWCGDDFNCTGYSPGLDCSSLDRGEWFQLPCDAFGGCFPGGFLGDTCQLNDYCEPRTTTNTYTRSATVSSSSTCIIYESAKCDAGDIASNVVTASSTCNVLGTPITTPYVANVTCTKTVCEPKDENINNFCELATINSGFDWLPIFDTSAGIFGINALVCEPAAHSCVNDLSQNSCISKFGCEWLGTQENGVCVPTEQYRNTPISECTDSHNVTFLNSNNFKFPDVYFNNQIGQTGQIVRYNELDYICLKNRVPGADIFDSRISYAQNAHYTWRKADTHYYQIMANNINPNTNHYVSSGNEWFMCLASQESPGGNNLGNLQTFNAPNYRDLDGTCSSGVFYTLGFDKQVWDCNLPSLDECK
jgi:hypothetical protein